MTNLFLMLIAMVGWHCLADYPLQGDFMAKAKNPAAPLPGVPWTTIMSAHAAIHAAGCALITGSPWVFVLEFGLHFYTDWLKCRGKISFNEDQAAHLVAKVAYVVFFAA